MLVLSSRRTVDSNHTHTHNSSFPHAAKEACSGFEDSNLIQSPKDLLTNETQLLLEKEPNTTSIPMMGEYIHERDFK